ncbi:MAG: hypothetical protein LBU84_07800 [Prevotella sp.]|jgi:hypothetical protein|nr:hypothetical protein [Prevotella sp.]
MKKTTANIFVNTSRSIIEPNVESINEYKIEDNGVEYNKIQLDLETSFECSDKKIQYKLEQIAKIYTLVISKFEQNLRFGCPYFTLDWKNRNVQNNAEINFSNNSTLVTEKIGLVHQVICKNINVIKLYDLNAIYDNNYLENEYNNLLLDNYYSACVSNRPQSKFFYLFVIWECYEDNDFFKNSFNEKLFSDIEIDDFLGVIKSSTDNYERKKSVIQEYKNRTLKSRSEKFYEYLINRNISIVSESKITSSDIKKIIEQRDSLFHTSSKFDDKILYDKLFPIIQELLLMDVLKKLNGT